MASIDEDYPALREDMLDVIEGYFDDDRNTVSMDYRLTTATVS